MNEIISLNPLNMASQMSFKDSRLAEATKRIISIYTDAAKYADTKNREIASILSTIKNQKAYEKDGFKSVAEYADKVFSIKKQNAYSLASAGDIYNDTKASDELKAFSPSKLSELSKVATDKLEKAIKDGKISADTTQKELREFAATTAQKKEKPVVVDTYTARIVSPYVPDDIADDLTAPRSMDEWDEYFEDYIKSFAPSRAPEIIKLPKCAPYTAPLAEKKTTQRRVYITEKHAYAVEFYTYNPTAPVKSTAPKFTIEQLKQMLAAAEAEEDNRLDEDGDYDEAMKESA